MNHFELRDEAQKLEHRLKNEKSLRRKLQIQLASRDKRIEILYRTLSDKNIPIPEVKESRNLKLLRERGSLPENMKEKMLEQLADEQFGGPPSEGTINSSYERGRHDGFIEAIQEYCI